MVDNGDVDGGGDGYSPKSGDDEGVTGGVGVMLSWAVIGGKKEGGRKGEEDRNPKGDRG